MTDADYLPYVNSILLAVISLGIAFIYRIINHNTVTIGKINDRVIVLETDFTGHERWCGERNVRNEREHAELHTAVDITRKSVHDMRNEVFALVLKKQTGIGKGDE